MLEMDVKLEGLDDLFASLDATKADAIKVRALKEAGKVLQTAISASAPVKAAPDEHGNSLPDGALKNDVVLSVSRSKHSVAVGFGKYTKHVARWMEFGFHHFKKGKFVDVRKGFFRRAVDGSQEAAREALYNSILAGMQKAFKSRTEPSED